VEVYVLSSLWRPAAFSLSPQVHIIVFGETTREVHPFIDCSGAELQHNARNLISERKTLPRKESCFQRERNSSGVSSEMPRGPEGKSALMAAARKKQNAATTKRFNLANGAHARRLLLKILLTVLRHAPSSSSLALLSRKKTVLIFFLLFVIYLILRQFHYTQQRLDRNLCGEGNKKGVGSIPEKCVFSLGNDFYTRCQDLAQPFCLFACARLCFSVARALWEIKETDAYSSSHLPTSLKTSCRKKGAYTTCMCV
jgi:hypothetical protein